MPSLEGRMRQLGTRAIGIDESDNIVTRFVQQSTATLNVLPRAVSLRRRSNTSSTPSGGSSQNIIATAPGGGPISTSSTASSTTTSSDSSTVVGTGTSSTAASASPPSGAPSSASSSSGGGSTTSSPSPTQSTHLSSSDPHASSSSITQGATGDTSTSSSPPGPSSSSQAAMSSPPSAEPSPLPATGQPSSTAVTRAGSSAPFSSIPDISPNPSTTPQLSQASQPSSRIRTDIIAGVVGGVGGLILLTMVALFFCVRRRRRKHATPLDWEAVRTSVFRSPSHSRTPKSIHSTHSEAPLSAPMTDTSSQYATAQENVYSPTRPGNARTNISPLLIVQSAPRSEESYHGADEEYDPFADPLAMARERPRIPNMSPTIRVSDTTLVDQAWAGKGTAYKMEMLGAGGTLAKGPALRAHESLLAPPPPLSTVVGRPSRLSNDSLDVELRDHDSAAGFAM